jgi:hypothetical protein
MARKEIEELPRMEVPKPEFINIPPKGVSLVVAYTTGRALVQKFIGLDAIDHIDWEVGPR